MAGAVPLLTAIVIARAASANPEPHPNPTRATRLSSLPQAPARAPTPGTCSPSRLTTKASLPLSIAALRIAAHNTPLRNGAVWPESIKKPRYATASSQGFFKVRMRGLEPPPSCLDTDLNQLGRA